MKAIPAWAWMKSYNRGELTNDLIAGVIVTIMLIPQSLAYALLAGLPPQVGLYASILPLVVYAIFGSSRTLAVGPVAVISLMTAASVSKVAEQGTPEYLAAAIILAFLSGVILLVMGVLRLGVLANLLSHPVVSGFITASGILIAASQLKHILGISANGHSLVDIIGSLIENLHSTNFETLLIGGSAIIFLYWVRGGLKPLLLKFGLRPRFADLVTKAGPVAAVLLTTLYVFTFSLFESGVSVVGEIPQGIPAPTLPDFKLEIWQELLPAALLISVIGFVESVSIAHTLAAKRRQRINPNQELIGLGGANIAAALSGGYPVTGGFARSVVNFDAGAQTPLAGIFTAIGIALTALFLTPLFYFLPQATLSATIIVAVLSLVDFATIRRSFRYCKRDFVAMIATIILTLMIGVEVGVMMGVILSVLLYIWKTSQPHIAVVGQVPGTEHFRNILRHKVIVSDHVFSFRIDESLYFVNARYLEDKVYDFVAQNPSITDVVMMCPAINEIDGSALESLEAINERLETAGVTFHLSEVKGPVMDRLHHSHFLDELTGQVFLSQYEAMKTLDPEATSIAPDWPQ